MADTGRVIVDVDGNLKPLKGRLAKLASSHKMTLDEKGFTQPLGRITGKLGEFDKSLDASNARVVAFGASAGAIYAVQRALTETVRSAISVEKTLADINVILNVSNKSLERFSDRLFKVAGQTGQSFQSVAEAATELARQGLSVEQTLKRTSDALVLTRLSGMSATQSVETLTAAINSFSKSALTSTEIINKLANVDAAFAVSTNDLAEALRRVGSSAADANISFDQLVAAVTSAQQTTARGGAVIGNSFKTIFTRLQRPRVLQQLEMLGIATRDLGGETKPVINILQSLAKQYDKLSTAQKSQITELIGGVFQINIVKAALSDLGKEYSVYERALQTSVSSTDEAIKRNEKLNETLSALVNKTFANLQKAAAGIGEGVFGPSMRSFLDTLNAGLEGGDTDGEGIGAKIGKGIFKGIENVISGPGLVLAFAGLTKIIARLGSTTGDAFKTLVLQTNKSKERESFERAIEQRLRGQDGYMDQIVNGTMTVEDAHQLISKQIDDENRKLDIQASKVREIAGLMQKQGFFAFSDKKERPVKRKAGGLVPDKEERRMAAEGGYTAGLTRRTRISPGLEVITNSRENIKQFPGMKQKAVLPPMGSRAADAYRQDFIGTHGFDPYAGQGFIPNFRKGAGGAKKSQPKQFAEGRDYESALGVVLGADPSVTGAVDWGKNATYKKANKDEKALIYSITGLDIGKLRGKNIDAHSGTGHTAAQNAGKIIRANQFYHGGGGKRFRNQEMNFGNLGYTEITGEPGGKARFNTSVGALKKASSTSWEQLLLQDQRSALEALEGHKLKGNFNRKHVPIEKLHEAGRELAQMGANKKRKATGFIPQFASKSDAELKTIIRQKLQAGSVQGFNNDRYQRLIASDPTLRGMYDTVMASKQQSRAASEAGRAERKATAAARPRLNVLFAKNLSGVDLGKSAVAGYGFSSKMPNAKRNFDTSFLKRYPNMVKGIGYDMFKSMPGANAIKTRNMMKQFSVSALDPAARGQVSGRVFESFIKAMSTQIIPGQETGSERIDMKRHQLKPAYRSLFTKGAATNLGHHGSEIRFGDITTSKAMQKQGYAGGFVPNFNAVNRAMETERMMGGDPEFRQFPFPHVADKSRQKDFRAVLRDHPNLSGDMRRSKEMQESMFGAQGHVPNFAVPAALAAAGRLGGGLMSRIGGSRIGKSFKGIFGSGKSGDQDSSGLLAMSLVVPQVTGMLEGMASEGDKLTKGISASTNAVASAGVAFKTMPGALGKLVGGLALFGGLTETLKISTDKSFELAQEVEKATEQMTNQTNASQVYLTAQENLATALAEAVPDEEKIAKLRDQMMTAMTGMSDQVQKEIIAAANGAESREVLEKANAELAKRTERVAKQLTLSNLRTEGTLFGTGIEAGGFGPLFGGDQVARNFSTQFLGGSQLQGLDKSQRDKLLAAANEGINIGDMSRDEMVKFFTERIGLEKEYAENLPGNNAQLKRTQEELQRIIKTRAEEVSATQELIEKNKPYREEIEKQQKIISSAKTALAGYNEQLSALMATIFDEASKARKFRGDTIAGARRTNLGIAESRLDTMRPFMSEEAVARSEFRLQQATRQENTAAKMRQAEFDSNQKINEIVSKMAKTVTGQLGQGGTTAGLSEQQRAASTRFRVGAFNMVQSGLRGPQLAEALDRLSIQSLGGTREQVPQAITELKTELLKASLDEQSTLAEIARANQEQKVLQEKQYQEQRKQIQIQKDLKVQGGAQSFLQGGTGMMTQVAMNRRVLGFARRSGNLELAGRGALAVNQDIRNLTGRETNFGRDLAIRGNALRLRRNANIAGFGMSGGEASRIARNQIDEMIKPVQRIGAVERAVADSAQQASAMGPVLQKAFTDAWNGTGFQQSQATMIQSLRSIAYTNQVIAGARSAITRAQENIRTKSDGYIPNFNAVMGYGIEKNNVMNSSQYTPSQKMRARPMRKIVNGQSTWMNDQESLVRNFMGSGKDAVLTPRMMGMAAEGYIPNFAPKYRYGSMSLQQLMYQMQIARRGKVSQSHRDNLARAYRTTRRGVRAHGGMLAGGYNTAFQNIWNPQYMGGRRSHPIRALGGANDFHLARRMFRGNETNLLGAGQYAPDHIGRMMNQAKVGTRYSYQRQLAIEAASYNYGQGSSWKTNALPPAGSSRAMYTQGPGMFQRSRNWLNARGPKLNLSGFGGPSFRDKEIARYNRLRDAGKLGRHTSFLRGGFQLGGMGARGMHIAGMLGRGVAMAGRGLMSPYLLIPQAGDLIGKGLGMGMESLVGRKVSADDKRVFGGGWDTATDWTGTSSIFRAAKATGGILSNDWRRTRDDKGLRNKTTQRMMRRLGGPNSPAFKEYLRQVKKNLRTEKSGDWFAEGYIPNFARGTNLAGLFSGYSKFHHQERSRYLGMSARYGAPGLGWLNHPSLSSRAMQTPGLRREMLRRSGITGGEQFRSYPTMGKFASEGIINSQMRERRQSGMNDVYTKFVNTPRYKGLATFNGSERGMEEMVVNSHPNPSRAGYAAEGQVPNFASLTKRLESVSESIGALNENMSSMAAPQATSESTQGSVSLSMQPMNININHSGNLTTQMSEVQNQLVAALDGAISSSMPGVYNALKGPPTT